MKMSPEPGQHSADRLVAMANQIGLFFSSQPGDHAARDTATHLRKFWNPRMRGAIVAHLDAGGAGLAPTVRDAVAQLRDSATSQ
jgi:formate dehydrogenase subunit delta